MKNTVIKLFIEIPHFPTRKTASLSLLKGYVACTSYFIIPGAQYTEGTSDYLSMGRCETRKTQ